MSITSQPFALVTGATGGIGSRVCMQLAESGVPLLIVSRDGDKLTELSHNLREAGAPEVVSIQVNFANPDSQKVTTKAILSCDLNIHKIVLIYPSIPKSSDLIPSSEIWREAWETCFIGPLDLLKAALGKAFMGTKVVLVSGIAGVQAFPTLPLSGATRAAWLAEAKTISFDLAKKNIHLNTVSLGGTLTERFRGNLKSKDSSKVPPEDSPEFIPLGHYADPDNVAEVICTLLSDFSNHMVGSNVIIDGGLTKKY